MENLAIWPHVDYFEGVDSPNSQCLGSIAIFGGYKVTI